MYGKFYQSTFTGSMYAAGANVFAVWGYIIAHADKDGELEINPRVVAGLLGMEPGAVQDVLDYLMEPDPESRSPEHDGRRLVHLRAFEYLVPQYPKYSGIRNAEHRREQNREAQRRSRERADKMENADRSAKSAHIDVDVDVDSSSSTHGTSAGADVPAAVKKQAIKVAREWLESIREEYPRRKGGQKWPLAEDRIRAIVKSGQAEPSQLLDGVKRYARFCQAEALVGTSKVMQAATFFGAGTKGWEEEWSTDGPDDQEEVKRLRRQLDGYADAQGWIKGQLMSEHNLTEDEYYARLETRARAAADRVAGE